MGVILDNATQFNDAVHMYKQFLALCISSKNQQGETLAYNCLGIDYFKLKNFDEAIQYHNKHLELADHTGRLVAHTNLGIVFQAMGLSEHAAIHHQHAIEYANRMGSKDAQCFAVGNLGVAAFQQGDLQTSRICMQYHLNMARRQKGKDKSSFTVLANNAVDNDAHHQLGQVAASDGRLEEASSHFARSVEISRQMNDQASEERSCVMLGVAQGMLNFEQLRESLLAPPPKAVMDFEEPDEPQSTQEKKKSGSGDEVDFDDSGLNPKKAVPSVQNLTDEVDAILAEPGFSIGEEDDEEL
jgi:tetratricopeptide (TPR) repeat protein